MNKSVQNGIVAALVGIIISIVSTLFFSDKIGRGFHPVLFVLNTISFVTTVYLMVDSGNTVKKLQNGFLTFKEGLKPVFLTGAVNSIITTLFYFLSKYVLFVDVNKQIMQNAMDKQYDKMIEQGYSEEAADSAMEMAAKFANMGDWFVLPGLLVVMFIIALIIAAIIKRKPAEF